VRTAVLVVQVVGVLPDIEADDGLALDAGDGLAHQWAVLVGGGADRELLVRADHEPGPAGAEAGGRALAEFFLELGEAAELGVNRRGQLALGGAALAAANDGPAEGVVAVATGIVAHAAADGLGNL